jgi:hypothetical protein
VVARKPLAGGASRFFYCAKVSAANATPGSTAFETQVATHRYGEGIGGSETSRMPAR